MSVFEQLGSLALATRLKLLSESLAKDVANVYRQLNIAFEPRWFTLFWTLKQKHTLTITELAQELRQTHAAAVQLTNLLEKKGLLISNKDKNDERRRQVSLSANGLKLFNEVEPVLNAIEQANSDLLLLSAPDFLANLEAIEQALEQKNMHDRILENLGLLNHDFTIQAYAPAYKNGLQELNREWMEEHPQQLKEEEKNYLEHPEEAISQATGIIFLALQNKAVVGSSTLMGTEDGTVRLQNLIVSKEVRGKGIGSALFEQSRTYALSKGAATISFYTYPAMVGTINFFIKKGFSLTMLSEKERAQYGINTLKLSLPLKS